MFKRLFFITLLIFFLLELSFRAIVPNEEFTALSSRWNEPYLHFGDFKTNLSDHESPEAYGYIRNYFAYTYEGTSKFERGDFLNFENQKPSSENIVFLVGGSAALGDGAKSNNGRLASQLNNLIKKDLFFLTRAGRAYQSTQERLIFEFYLKEKLPKAIVFFDGFNDMNQLESAAMPGDPYNMAIYYSINESSLFRFMYALSSVSKVISFITKKQYENIINKSANDIFTNPDKLRNYNKLISDYYWKNISNIKNECKLHEIKCFFIMQPALGGKNSSRFFWSAYPELISKKPAGLESQFLNLVPKYESRFELFVDPVHMNESGQALVAKDIIEFISPQL